MKTRTSNIEFSKTKDRQAQLPVATIFDVKLILQKQITTDGNNITGSCTSEDGDVLINYHSFKGPNFGFDIALIDETTVAISSGASINKIGIDIIDTKNQSKIKFIKTSLSYVGNHNRSRLALFACVEGCGIYKLNKIDQWQSTVTCIHFCFFRQDILHYMQ